MSRNLFKSIAVFLFVFTYISNKYANSYTHEEIPSLRLNCWCSIQSFFNTKEYVEAFGMPSDAKEYYYSFKNHFFVKAGFKRAIDYCDEQDPAVRNRCKREMRFIFGGTNGSPKTNTELIMYSRSKAMLSEVYGESKFGDYMIPYWDYIRSFVFVFDYFPNAQTFCEERYSVEKATPVLYNLFPAEPDLDNKV